LYTKRECQNWAETTEVNGANFREVPTAEGGVESIEETPPIILKSQGSHSEQSGTPKRSMMRYL